MELIDAKNPTTQVQVNPNLPEIPNYPVPNPGTGSGETIAIVMAMTIFGSVVKKLIA